MLLEKEKLPTKHPFWACLMGGLILSVACSAMAGDAHHSSVDRLMVEASALLPPAENAATNLISTPASRASKGEWSSIIPWTPHIPVSAALMPDGRLLTFASNQRTSFPDGVQFTYAAVWDPATGAFTEINNPSHDMFCAGLSLLEDGRLMVNGGNGIMGSTALSSVFDWRTKQWSRAQSMPEGRWYNTSVALPNGEIFTAGGNGGGFGAGTIDQWRAASGWRRMSGIDWANVVTAPPGVTATDPNWHPLLMLAPDGRIAHFGPHHDMNWLTPAGTGLRTAAGASLPGTQYPKQSAWAMYDVGRVLVAGGQKAINDASVVPLAFTVDLNQPTPVVTPTAPMSYARAFGNSVILPNGEVMVVGGSTVGTTGSDAGSVFTPEIWTPATGKWRAVADAAVPRNYHSLALLLPDGRVWSGGGGLYADLSVDHQDAQMYTHPALFNADGTPAVRPVIYSTPDRISPGAVFTVTATSGMQYFSFIRLAAQTHSVSTDLRHLRFNQTVTRDGRYALSAPDNLNVLTPGYWMLFAVNSTGAWSTARIIQVTSEILPVMTNPGTQTVAQGAAVTLPMAADARGSTLSFSASGLPAGLFIHPTTGVISGSATAVPGTYRSAVTVTAAGRSATVVFNWEVKQPALGTGQLLREWWSQVDGGTVLELRVDARYPGTPDGRDFLGAFETPSNWGQQTGQRVRGFLTVPVSGAYRFFLSSDDQSMLLLSTDENPANAVNIAFQPDWTPPRTWDWYAEQASAVVTLQAGRRYYIEALVKERLGDDHLAVGWLKPGDTAISVIDGAYLQPYLPAQNAAVYWSFEESAWSGATGEVRAQGLYALDGTAQGGATTGAENPALAGSPGSGRSAVFNGRTQAVVVPYHAALNPADVTVAAWVRVDAASGSEQCLLSAAQGADAGYGLWLSAGGEWQFRTGGAGAALKGPVAVPGQWTHVAATFDTTTAAARRGVRRLFVNGVLVAEDAAVYRPNTTQPLVMAAAGSSGTGYFAGALDEVSVFQAPLAASDVFALSCLRHSLSVPNLPPRVAAVSDQVSVLGEVVAVPVLATDPENNALSFKATGLPAGLEISPSGGVIFGQPTALGTFTASVSVSDGVNAPSTISWEWKVGSSLSLENLTAKPQPAGAQQTYTVKAAAGVNPRYKWNFGDGTPETAWSSSLVVSHTYASPGRYLVTLTATDDTGMVTSTSFYQAVHAPLTAKRPNVSSTIAFQDLGNGAGRVWCVNPDNNSVTGFDAVSRARYAEISVGVTPRALAFGPDGRLWVSNGESANLSVIDTTSRTVVKTVSMPRGSRPWGLVFDPNGSALWVALEDLGRVLRLNPTTGAQTGLVDAGGPVRHLSASADGARLYASRFVTPRVPGEDTATPQMAGVGGQVLVVRTANLTVERTVLLAPSQASDTETSARGLPNYLGAVALSPDGLSGWVPSKQDNIQRGVLRDGQPLNHETTVRAVASRLDLTTQAESPAMRVDFDNAGVPSASAFDPWGIYLFTTLEASRDVVVLDAWKRQEVLRIPVGRAPQGLVLSPDGRTLYVQNFMDRSVTVHDVGGILDGGAAEPLLLATLGMVSAEALPANVLLGKQLFYDAKDTRLALQEYMSCASCHNDGGHDGRVWDMTGFGEGLRNTLTLKGHGNHKVLHWSGNFDEVQDFDNQIRNFAGGSGLITQGTPNAPLGAANAGRSADLDALAAYLRSLTKTGASPSRTASGALNSIALEGQQIFRTQNCAACHSGTNLSNSALGVFANIGTLKPASGQRLGGPLTGLSVPTLRGVWSTAPYLHDGSAATLGDAIRAHQGVNLTSSEMNKLVAFVSCIDDEPAAAPLPFTVQVAAAASQVTGAFTATAIFTNAASGFTVDDVVVTNGTKSKFSGAGAIFTWLVTPTAPGPVTVSIPAAAATDSTALGNLASNVLTVNFGPVDAVAPTVVLAAAGSASQAFAVTASFSEAVTGLEAADFDVSNGAVTALVANGNVWSATVTPAYAGTVVVRLPAGAAQDLAGNGNVASNSVTVAYAPVSAVAANGVSEKNTLIGGGATNTAAVAPVLTADTGLRLVQRGHAAVDAVLIRSNTVGSLALESTSDLVHWTRAAVVPVVANVGQGLQSVTWKDVHKLSRQGLANGVVRVRTLVAGGASTVSQPVGWQQVAARSGVQSCGVNLVHPPLYAGAVQAATGAQVVLPGQAALAAQVDPARACYLEITAGPQAGHRVDVRAVTATGCVLMDDSAHNTVAPGAVDWSAAVVCLRAHVTVADVFDPARFQAAAEPKAADQVLFHDGRDYQTCWLYDDGARRSWVQSVGAGAEECGGKVIPPGDGLMLQVASAQPQGVLFTGMVRTTPFVRVLPAAGGYTLLANPWPVAATPTAAGMTGAAFVAAGQASAADQLQLLAADAQPGAAGYTGYWLQQGAGQGQWTALTPAGAGASQNGAVLLNVGRATFLKVQASAVARGLWIIPPP